MAVMIASELIATLVAAAAVSPRAEICGLLLGSASRIDAALACRNVAADPATRFEIDPVALLAAHRDARRGGPAVVGHYHSHPTNNAEPSSSDAAEARPDGVLWMIVTADEARLWRATAGGAVLGRFDAVDIIADPTCAASVGTPQRADHQTSESA